MSAARPSPSAQFGVREGRRSVLDGPGRLSQPLGRGATVVSDRAVTRSSRQRFFGRLLQYGATYAATLGAIGIVATRMPLPGALRVQGVPGGPAMADPASVLLHDPFLILALGLLIGLAHLGKWMADRAATETAESRIDIGLPPRPAAGSWSAKIAAAQAWSRQTARDVEEIKATVRQRGAWGWRHKLVPYLMSFVTYVSVLVTLMVMSKNGIGHLIGVSARIGLVVPAIVMGLMLSGTLLPVILVLDRVAARIGIARGASDVAIGLMLNSLFLFPVLSRLSQGQLPEPHMVLTATAYLIAGAAAGFMFWRAEGYPQRTEAAPEPADR